MSIFWEIEVSDFLLSQRYCVIMQQRDRSKNEWDITFHRQEGVAMTTSHRGDSEWMGLVELNRLWYPRILLFPAKATASSLPPGVHLSIYRENRGKTEQTDRWWNTQQGMTSPCLHMWIAQALPVDSMQCNIKTKRKTNHFFRKLLLLSLTQRQFFISLSVYQSFTLHSTSFVKPDEFGCDRYSCLQDTYNRLKVQSLQWKHNEGLQRPPCCLRTQLVAELNFDLWHLWHLYIIVGMPVHCSTPWKGALFLLIPLTF